MALPAIAGVLAKVAGPILVTKLTGVIGQKKAADIAAAAMKETIEKAAADPVLRNELNAEKPWESRIAAGASAVLVGQAMAHLGPVTDAIDTLAPIVVGAINLLGADLRPPPPGYIGQVLGACVTLWGAGYVFYGRFRRGLKPLFSRKG